MKENDKDYLEILINDSLIETKIVEKAINDVKKSLKRIKKFHDKVIKAL